MVKDMPNKFSEVTPEIKELAKKCNKKMYPASITKIMTALLTIENCKMDEMVTFSDATIPVSYTHLTLPTIA